MKNMKKLSWRDKLKNRPELAVILLASFIFLMIVIPYAIFFYFTDPVVSLLSEVHFTISILVTLLGFLALGPWFMLNAPGLFFESFVIGYSPGIWVPASFSSVFWSVLIYLIYRAQEKWGAKKP